MDNSMALDNTSAQRIEELVLKQREFHKGEPFPDTCFTFPVKWRIYD